MACAPAPVSRTTGCMLSCTLLSHNRRGRVSGNAEEHRFCPRQLQLYGNSTNHCTKQVVLPSVTDEEVGHPVSAAMKSRSSSQSDKTWTLGPTCTHSFVPSLSRPVGRSEKSESRTPTSNTPTREPCRSAPDQRRAALRQCFEGMIFPKISLPTWLLVSMILSAL